MTECDGHVVQQGHPAGVHTEYNSVVCKRCRLCENASRYTAIVAQNQKHGYLLSSDESGRALCYKKDYAVHVENGKVPWN